MRSLARTVSLLERLVGFPTVSSASNLELIDWARDVLETAGFQVRVLPSGCGEKAGLLAKWGEGEGGVLLSAHTDVVPVEGQSWSRDPFSLAAHEGRYHGRGATDMKGFIACVLAMAERFHTAPPVMPVSIVLSFDEEVGCLGIPQMIDHVIPVLGRPDFAIVGEPTLMRPATGHKGKASFRATSRGTAGHSALAPRFVNALHGAADLIIALRQEQQRLFEEGARNDAFDPPVSTVHAGVMQGGTALNIVPDHAEVLFEIRHLAEEQPDDILQRIDVPETVTIAKTGSYPGLETDPSDPALRLVLAALEDRRPLSVAFGTEAGYFAGLGIPTLVCGPGTMDDGHQPDESIAAGELVRCLAFLDRLFAGRAA